MTPAGTSSSPCTMPTRSTRSADAARGGGGQLAPDGCGVPGPGRPQADHHPDAATSAASPTTASMKARQWKSGSGPTRKSRSAPTSSVPVPRPRCGARSARSVTPLTMRATGRRARWSKKCSPSNVASGSVWPWPSRAAMAVVAPRPASTQPSRATTRTGSVEVGLLVDLEDLGQLDRRGSSWPLQRVGRHLERGGRSASGNPSTLPWSPAPAPAT